MISNSRPATCFHAAMGEHADGDVIPAGGQGDRHARFHLSSRAYLFESVCEQIRQAEFPTKPSRLRAVYACEDVESLLSFCDAHPSRPFKYEVAPIDPDVTIHRATWEIQPGYRLHAMVHSAWLYWTRHPTADIEVVIGGDVRVLRRIG